MFVVRNVHVLVEHAPVCVCLAGHNADAGGWASDDGGGGILDRLHDVHLSGGLGVSTGWVLASSLMARRISDASAGGAMRMMGVMIVVGVMCCARHDCSLHV